MIRPLPGILCCALLVAALGVGEVRAGAAERKAPTARIGLGTGYQPPPFSARDLKGTVHAVADDYKNHILVLHFWASWCPYCRGEIPELKELQLQWASRDVRVVTVSTDEDLEGLKQFVEREGLPYPVIADLQADESIAEQYGVSGIPVTYVIAKDGRLFARINGRGEIIAAVERALQSSTPSE